MELSCLVSRQQRGRKRREAAEKGGHQHLSNFLEAGKVDDSAMKSSCPVESLSEIPSIHMVALNSL